MGNMAASLLVIVSGASPVRFDSSDCSLCDFTERNAPKKICGVRTTIFVSNASLRITPILNQRGQNRNPSIEKECVCICHPSTRLAYISTSTSSILFPPCQRKYALIFLEATLVHEAMIRV